MAAWFILPPSLQIVCVCLYLCRFVCCLSGLSALSIVNSFVVTCVSCGVVSSSSSANRAKKNELLSFFSVFFFWGLIEGCDIWQIRLKILWASTRRTRYSFLDSPFDWVTDWPSNWQPIRPYTRTDKQTDRPCPCPCPGPGPETGHQARWVLQIVTAAKG